MRDGLVGLGLSGSVVVAVAAGCAAPATAASNPTQAAWTGARAHLSELRATEHRGPFGAVVQVSLREPRTGQTFRARGAVAVDPHRALRLVLLGPGGATALDVWATRDRWRFDSPPANILRRGNADDDASLPIGFFRWWFLEPIAGRLLTSIDNGGDERFVLRSGSATVDFRSRPADGASVFRAERLSPRTRERVVVRGSLFGLSPGDQTDYDDLSSGVHVEVSVESLSDTPSAEAFLDPDLARSTTPERLP